MNAPSPSPFSVAPDWVGAMDAGVAARAAARRAHRQMIEARRQAHSAAGWCQGPQALHFAAEQPKLRRERLFALRNALDLHIAYRDWLRSGAGHVEMAAQDLPTLTRALVKAHAELAHAKSAMWVDRRQMIEDAEHAIVIALEDIRLCTDDMARAREAA